MSKISHETEMFPIDNRGSFGKLIKYETIAVIYGVTDA